MEEKPSILMPALYGGAIIGVISAVPFINLINCFCCAGVILGGFLSVFFYKNDLSPAAAQTLTNNDCLKLGALAGVFGALFGTVLNALILIAIGPVASEAILDILRGVELPPEAMDQIEDSIYQSAELGAVSIVTGLVFSLIINPLFGLLGGLIGFSVYKPKTPTPGVQPPPMNPPVVK